MEVFGKQAGLSIKRFGAFTVSTGVVFGFIAALVEAGRQAVNFQNEMTRLKQITRSSDSTLKGLSDEVSRLGITFGVSSSEILDAGETLAQAGLSANEVKKAMQALTKSDVAPSFTDLRNTTEGLISIMGQFKNELTGVEITAKDFESVLGSINKVSADFAVESDDIVTAIRGAGAVFAQASSGLKEPKEALNELVATFSAVRSTTRESAESIATGLRTIFARIQRRDTIDFLKDMGIELTDAEGKFIGVFNAVKALGDGLKGLDSRDVRFAQVAEELGGIRQLSKLLPLIKQSQTGGLTDQIFARAQGGANSLDSDVEISSQSLIRNFAKVREEFLKLIRDVTETGTFKTLASVFLASASAAIKFADSIKPLIPLITILGGVNLANSLGSLGKGFSRAFTQNTIGGSGPHRAYFSSPQATSHKFDTSVDRLTNSINALNANLSLRKGIKGFASGGFIPGSGSKDDQLALLMKGEYVLNKETTRKIGVDTLDKWNNGGQINKYAKGSRKKTFNVDEALGYGPLAREEASQETARQINSEGFGRLSKSSGAAVRKAMKEIANKARLEAERALLEEVSKISISGYDINDLVEPRKSYPKRAGVSGNDNSFGRSIFPDKNLANPFELVQGGPAGRRRNLSGYAPSLYGGPAQATDTGIVSGAQTREQAAFNQAVGRGLQNKSSSQFGQGGFKDYSADELEKARKVYAAALEKTGKAEKALSAATLIIARDRRNAAKANPISRFSRIKSALNTDITGGYGQRFGQALPYAAIGATILGSQIQSTANTAGRSATGAGIAGAGVGVLTGSQFGPAGAVAGGLIGGLVAANDAFLEFNRSNALKELEEATKGASTALEAFERSGNKEGLISGINASFGNLESKRNEIVRQDINQRETSSAAIGGRYLSNFDVGGIFSGTTNFLRRSIYGNEAVEAADLQSRNTQIGQDRNTNLNFFRGEADASELRAQKARSLFSNNLFDKQSAARQTEDFRAVGFTDALFKSQAEQRIRNTAPKDFDSVFVEINKLAIERGRELLNEEKRIADDRKAIEESIKKSSEDARLGVESLAERLDVFSAKIQTLGVEFEAAASQSSTLIDQLSGNFSLNRSFRVNPFDNIKAYNETDLRATSQAIGAGKDSSLVEGALNLKRLETELPKFVRSLRESDIEGGSVQSKFKEFIGTNFANLPKEVADNFIANFNAKIRKTEGGESNLKELQREGNIVKSIGGTDILETQVKLLSDLFKKRADVESAYINEITKIAQVRQVIEDRQVKIDNAIVQRKRIEAAETGDLPSLSDLDAPRRARLGRLTSSLPGPTNAAGVAASISSAQARLKELDTKPIQSADDIRERADLATKIKDLTGALELVADSSDKLGLINEKLEESQNKREEKRGLARDLFANGAAGRFDIARNVGLLKQFLNADVTDKGGKVDPRRQAGLARFLDSNYDRIEAGLEFAKRNKELLKASGLKPDDIIKKFEEQLEKIGAPGLGGFKEARDEEAALKAERAATLKAQEEAATALRDVATVSLPDMIENANSAFKSFEKFVKEYLSTIEPKGKATGGYISGPGGPRSDSIPAMLSNGEYVVRADAVRRIGRANLDKLNSGKVGRFANGGLVGQGGPSKVLTVDTTAIQNVVLKLSEAVNKLAAVNIPSEITMTGTHKLEVIINGAEVLKNLMSGPLAEFVKAEIEKTVKKYIPLDARIGK